MRFFCLLLLIYLVNSQTCSNTTISYTSLQPLTYSLANSTWTYRSYGRDQYIENIQCKPGYEPNKPDPSSLIEYISSHQYANIRVENVYSNLLNTAVVGPTPFFMSYETSLRYWNATTVSSFLYPHLCRSAPRVSHMHGYSGDVTAYTLLIPATSPFQKANGVYRLIDYRVFSPFNTSAYSFISTSFPTYSLGNMTQIQYVINRTAYYNTVLNYSRSDIQCAIWVLARTGGVATSICPSNMRTSQYPSSSNSNSPVFNYIRINAIIRDAIANGGSYRPSAVGDLIGIVMIDDQALNSQVPMIDYIVIDYGVFLSCARPDAVCRNNNNIMRWHIGGSCVRVTGSTSKSRSQRKTRSRSPVKSRSKSRSRSQRKTRSQSPAKSRSKSRSRSQRKTLSKSPVKSKSKSSVKSRSRSKSSSKSKPKTKSRSQSLSRSQPKTKSKSHSISKSKSRSSSGSKSISKSKSHSKSNSLSRSRSRSRSKSKSSSQSASNSNSLSESMSDSMSSSPSDSMSKTESNSKTTSNSASNSASNTQSVTQSHSMSSSQSHSSSDSWSESDTCQTSLLDQPYDFNSTESRITSFRGTTQMLAVASQPNCNYTFSIKPLGNFFQSSIGFSFPIEYITPMLQSGLDIMFKARAYRLVSQFVVDAVYTDDSCSSSEYKAHTVPVTYTDVADDIDCPLQGQTHSPMLVTITIDPPTVPAKWLSIVFKNVNADAEVRIGNIQVGSVMVPNTVQCTHKVPQTACKSWSCNM